MRNIFTLVVVPVILPSIYINASDSSRQTHWSRNSFMKDGLLHSEKNIEVKRVAIIGAGAGGSSAAYFLKKLCKEKHPNLQIEVDIFEKSDRIGGRVLSRIFGEDEEKIEMGANAFVEENYHLMNATKEFNIRYEDNSRGNGTIGFYDGSEFISKMDGSYLGKISFFYRYGWGLYRANKFATKIKNQFLQLYDETQPPFESIKEMLDRTQLLPYMFRTTEDVLMKDWYAGSAFSKEFLPAISRNIYCSGGDLHSLSGAISLIAVAGSYTSTDGNDLFFKGYIENSNANLYLNSPVTEIQKISRPGYVYYNVKVNGFSVDKPYDSVIMANPFHQSGIQLKNIDTQIPQVEYRHVHMAIIEDALINPNFFNLKKGEEVPTVVFGINSSYPYTVISYSKENKRVVVEGTKPITLDSLSPILLDTPKYDQITIKNWLAYPVMKILKRSAPLSAQIPPIRLAPSFYYVNAIESAISCMEVEIMSARNIVRMVLNDLSSI